MKLVGGPHDGTVVESTRFELVLYADPLFNWKGSRTFAIYRREGRRYVFQGLESRQERRSKSGKGRVIATYYDAMQVPGA